MLSIKLNHYTSSMRNESNRKHLLVISVGLVLDSIMNSTFMLMELPCAIATYANCTTPIRLAFSSRVEAIDQTKNISLR